MPVFTSLSGGRRRTFRFIAILLFWVFLFSSLVFFTGFLIPESRQPLSYSEAFAAYNYYYSSANDKKITFTFDDGPTAKDTEAIAKVLKEYNVPATFFFIGEHVVQYPQIAKKIADDGFDLGNHTFTHSYNVHDSPSRLSVELGATSRVLERVTGERTRYYRPP
ncbi:polysaccharide deacetylase family protein, partial [Candidatus Parcubacteria bacterium]|nr:polysaccharide deacetylase family protein [Candidatus Parcubacteria bacterium]